MCIVCGFGSTHFYPASACTFLIACFFWRARSVVYICDGQEWFKGKLDERHRSAEIRRVKVSLRGAEKLPACLRNARRLLAGFFSQVAPCAHTASFQTARHANGPKSHAVDFASTQHHYSNTLPRSFWLSLGFYLFIHLQGIGLLPYQRGNRPVMYHLTLSWIQFKIYGCKSFFSEVHPPINKIK